MTLAERLGELWLRDRDVPVLWHAGTWWTCGQITDAAERVRDLLRDAGTPAGGSLGIVLQNSPEIVVAVLAVLADQRHVTFFSGLQPPARTLRDVAAVEPDVLIASEAQWRQLLDVDPAPAARRWLALAPDGWPLVMHDAASLDKPRDGSGPIAEAGSIELFTSGTTGPAKRITLTLEQIQRSLTSALRHNTGSAPVSASRSPALVSTPMSHIGGLWGVLQALAEGRPLVLLERFGVDAWVAAVREHRPRVTGLPPAAIRMIYDGNVPAEDLASLRAINAGTAPLAPDLVDDFLTRYGIPVLNVYGATEFAGSVAGWSRPLFMEWWTRKRGSVGRAQPGVDLRVVDSGCSETRPGEVGILQLRTRQGGSDHSWMSTTDLARIDEDGFLWIEGRADNVIIRGGFKVSPGAVCAVLESHPGVVEAVLCGLPDARLGEVPVAAVQTRPGCVAPSAGELLAHCRDRLAPYEVPIAIEVVAALPRSASMKVSHEGVLALFEDLSSDEASA
jgi:acyl-coenzyme A synthetase/AMP-(fatty) acid ligase